MVGTRLRASDGLFVWVFIMVLHEHHEGAYRYTDPQEIQNGSRGLNTGHTGNLGACPALYWCLSGAVLMYRSEGQVGYSEESFRALHSTPRLLLVDLTNHNNKLKLSAVLRNES